MSDADVTVEESPIPVELSCLHAVDIVSASNCVSDDGVAASSEGG